VTQCAPRRRPSPLHRGIASPGRWCTRALYPVDGSGLPGSARRAGQAAGSTTPRWTLRNRRRRWRSGSGSAAASSACLHMEITRERLEREFDLDLISTSPNVGLSRFVTEDTVPGSPGIVVHQPVGLARRPRFATSTSPVVKTTIIAPSEFIGTIMELLPVAARRSSAVWTTCRRSGWSCATQCRWGKIHL